MNKAAAMRRIQEQWLSFIMRGQTAQETLETLEAVVAGGATVVEVAFTTPDVCAVIDALRRRHGDGIVLAAGTVRTVEQARMAVDHGADAVVSPDLFAPVVEQALRSGAVSIPGCLTPTEIASALRLGADVVKIFPADVGGPRFLRYIRGPFPEARMLPAGAVTLDNAGAYLDAGAFAAVAGVTTEMGLPRAVAERRFDEVAQTTRRWLSAVREARAGLARPRSGESGRAAG
jgi:2-dehydro-3-deoxyphosphogluconate aldolase/(4S)-4-hydroxy-2-oxoglutarate aldolase